MTDSLSDDLAAIERLSRMEMARLWRFAPAGHRYFKTGTPLEVAFAKRFKELGGFSPAISKALGHG